MAALSQLRWSVTRRRRPAPPAPQGRARRRERPPVRAGADLRGVRDQRGGRPAGPLRRPQRHRAARPVRRVGSAACSTIPTRSSAPCAPASWSSSAPSASRGLRQVGDVGRIKHEHVGAATAAGVQVYPAATMSSPFGRSARVEIGQATRPTPAPPGSARRTRARRPSARRDRCDCSTRWARSAPELRSTGCR